MNSNSRSTLSKNAIAFFLLNPARSEYVNALARTLEADPKNLYRLLLRLEAEGILVSEFKGRERYFKLNAQYQFIKEYTRMMLPVVGVEAVLKRSLPLIKGVTAAYLFGSFASGKSNAASDIDVLLIGTQAPLEAHRVLAEAGRRIGREINAVNMAPDEFARRKKDRDQFISTVLENKYEKLL